MECIESEDEKIQAESYYYLAKIKLINNQKELAIQYANIALELNPKLIKVMEKDNYFSIIIGKVKLQNDKNVITKLNKKEEELIKYLDSTYNVVEKLTQTEINKKENINKERDI